MHAPKPAITDRIETEEQLEMLLTQPSTALQDFIHSVASPLLILGAGGKMGPTLAILAKRAAEAAHHPLEIIGVSRFGDSSLMARLNRHGVKTVTGDLLDPVTVRSLPETQNLIYLVGLKFGTAHNPSTTWAVNTLVPAHVADRYRRARIVALSTGNVYPMSAVSGAGSREADPLTPLGEYANSAVARERIFEFYARAYGTSLALLRLFYAVELRYGVLLDIARKVHESAPIDLANGYFNCVWQGDANEMVLRALSLASNPSSAWNLCRPEVFSVRAVATRLGELLRRTPKFSGVEASTALLGNSAALCARLGTPAVSLETMLGWIAKWVEAGGRNLQKPTHFESRDGQY